MAPAGDKRKATETPSGHMSKTIKIFEETHGASSGANGKGPPNIASANASTSPAPPPPSPVNSAFRTPDGRYPPHPPPAGVDEGNLEKIEILCTVITDSFDSRDGGIPSIRVRKCEGQRSLPIRGPPEPESVVIVGHQEHGKESWKGEVVRVIFTRSRVDTFYKVSVVHLQCHGSGVPAEDQGLPESIQA